MLALAAGVALAGDKALASGCAEPSFVEQTPVPVVETPTALAVADFNGDGVPDLAVADLTSTISPDRVAIRLGDGTGAFGPPAQFGTGDGVESIAIADFNGDSRLDIAAANSTQASISILLGDGTGAFSAQTVFPAGGWPVSLVTGDFDEDGDADLAVTNFFDATISVLLGNGTGGFAPPAPIASGSQPISLAVGDLNRDGHLDLAVARTYLTYNVLPLLGNGTGGFDPQPPTVTLGFDMRSILLVDFNSDGKLDLVAVDALDPSPSVRILTGLGNGQFGAPGSVTVGAEPIFIAAADLTRDGNIDLAVTNYDDNSISILPGDGAGGFGPRFDIPNQEPLHIAAADLNGDASPDLLVGNYGQQHVSLFLNSCAQVSHAPDCSLASVVPAELWPPNRRMVPIEITGIVDPDGGQIEIRVDSVTQDEPLCGPCQKIGGSHRRGTDAVIDAQGVLSLRAERSGRGNGRVYDVSFTATDLDGGSCQGTVFVCVPQNRHGGGCIDDGPVADSRESCASQ